MWLSKRRQFENEELWNLSWAAQQQYDVLQSYSIGLNWPRQATKALTSLQSYNCSSLTGIMHLWSYCRSIWNHFIRHICTTWWPKVFLNRLKVNKSSIISNLFVLFLGSSITLRPSNRKADKIISNALFRLVVEQQRCVLQPEDTFVNQEKEIVRLLESSEISLASEALSSLRSNFAIRKLPSHSIREDNTCFIWY